MAIDALQERIRKLKNPSVVDFGITPTHIPQHLLDEEGSLVKAMSRYCREVMGGLKNIVPAVRFSFSTFALLGSEGLAELSKLMKEAKKDFYVLLDSPEILSPWGADRIAPALFRDGGEYPCDGLIISPYIGSDAIKPFLPYCKERQKDLFLVLRSPNKSAPELQDLRTGGRLVHTAAADLAKRFGEPLIGKCGYFQVAGLASASAPDSLKNLRAKYPRLFLLVDGLDYPSGNAKNCSYAFDRLGHGAVVCAGPSVTAAWQENGNEGDYVTEAVQAAERMKRNITRYITIL